MENMGIKLIGNHKVVIQDTKNRAFQKKKYLRLQKYYNSIYKYNCCIANIIIQQHPV